MPKYDYAYIYITNISNIQRYKMHICIPDIFYHRKKKHNEFLTYKVSF